MKDSNSPNMARSLRPGIVLLLVFAAGGCAGPGRKPALSDLEGCFSRVGRELAKDLEETFQDHPLLWVRRLSWETCTPRDGETTALECTRILAVSLARTTGWKVLLDGPPPGRPEAVLVVEGKVKEEEDFLAPQGKEVLEVTVRMAGTGRGPAKPWTSWYPLEESCSGFG